MKSNVENAEETLLKLFLSNDYSQTINTIHSLFTFDRSKDIEVLCAHCEFLIGNFKSSYSIFARYLQQYSYKQSIYLWFELTQFLSVFNYCQAVSKIYEKSICTLLIQLRSFVS